MQLIEESMSFIKFLRYFFVLAALSILACAAYEHLRLNHSDAYDISTTGLVVHKEVKKKSTGRAGSKKTSTRYYLGLTYKIKPDLNFDKRGLQLIEKHQIQNVKPRNDQVEKSISRILYRKTKVSRFDYKRYNINDKLIVFYRSNRPWRASLDLNHDRKMIPISIWVAIVFLFLGIIGFYSKRVERRQAFERKQDF